VILGPGRVVIVLTVQEVIHLEQEFRKPNTPLANLSTGTGVHRMLMIPVVLQSGDLGVPGRIDPYNTLLWEVQPLAE
jgi:hypothetical protein